MMKINNWKFREIFTKQVRTLFLTKTCRNSNLKNKNKGFALIEVIVSVVILSLVLVSAVMLLRSVGIAVEKNRDRLTATYLAQECLELVRNARDTAWRNHHQWDCAWTSDCQEKGILSSIEEKVSIEKKGEDVQTKFSRNFEADDKDSSGNLLENEAEITCTVSWGAESLSISEILTNWRKI